MKLGFLLLAGVCALTWLPSNGPTSRMETPDGIDTPAVRSVLRAVNELRTKGCYCPGNKWFGPVEPLRADERLNRAAQAHAEDMQQRKYFSHRSPEGRSVADRADQAGYRWSFIGENIAWGQPTPESVVESWQKSPGHCENMMRANYQHMGLGRAATYWVQMLGSPKRR